MLNPTGIFAVLGFVVVFRFHFANCFMPSQVTQTVPVSWFFQDTMYLQLQFAVCMV